MPITNCISCDFLIISIIILITYFYATRRYNHWKNKGIPFIKPTPIFGNILDILLMQKSIGVLLKDIHESINTAFVGIFVFGEPYLLVRDPDLIKSILVKDFAHFIDRTVTNNVRNDPLGSHLLFLMKNPDWKEIRRKLTPVFTSGKMKLMYKLLIESGEDLVQYLHKQIESNPIIETREISAKYTTDVITSTSFGINANCFKDENSQFRLVSRRVFDWSSFERGFATTCFFISPTLVKIFGMKFIDKSSTDFLREVFWKTIYDREQSNYVRNDVLDVIIQIRKQEKVDDVYRLSGDKLVAQAAQFFLAGFETSSTTISFTLYELALNPQIQKKLREEITEIKSKYGHFSYESLLEMKHLDNCIKETLRKYPVLPFLDRRCTKDYKIPDTDITIEQGTAVFISILGLHYDPQYFPHPDKYDPDRFLEENISNRPLFSYLPFGEGPRNCIGARFGIISSKSGVAHIISQFKVEVCDETQKKMVFEPKGFLIAPIGGLQLKFTKIKL